MDFAIKNTGLEIKVYLLFDFENTKKYCLFYLLLK